MKRDPVIFIVGCPRSGTTLLAAMLSRHSRLACGPETHVLAQGYDSLDRMDHLEKEWPESAISYLSGLEITGRKVVEEYCVGVHDLRRYLDGQERSVASVVEALPVLWASRVDKPRAMEKTPLHLRSVFVIRSLFPTSPIVRILRDPRDVALSLSRVPWASQNVSDNILRWSIDDYATYKFFERDAYACTVKYEELLRNPESTLQDICAVCGEHYEHQMLERPCESPAVVSSGEWWKAKVSGSLDTSRIDAWKRSMSDEDVTVAEAICGEAMSRYGYERTRRFRRELTVFPLGAGPSSQNVKEALYRLAGQGYSLRPVSSVADFREQSTGSGGIVILGEPSEKHWRLGRTGLRRLRSAINISAAVTRGGRGERAVMWLRGDGEPSSGGRAGLIIRKALGRVAQEIGGRSGARSRNGRIRVISTHGLGGPNPYTDLFYGALAGYGIEFAGTTQNDDSWLRAHADDAEVLHLHWPEQKWRYGRNKIGGGIRGVLGFRRYLRIAKALGLLVVWTVHNLEHHEGAAFDDRLGYRMLARQCDLLICHSNWAAEQVRARWRPRGQVIVMAHGNYSGIYPAPRNRDVVLAEMGLVSDSPVFCCVGGLRDYKGLDLAVKAIMQQTEAQLIIAGKDHGGFDVKSLVGLVNSHPRIRVIVKILSEQEFGDIVGASDAVLLPYRRITGSGALMAALTLGRPVVASRLPYFVEMLGNHPDVGFLFTPGKVPALREAIASCMAADKRLRESSALQLAQKLSWDHVVKPVAAALNARFGRGG